MTMMRKIALSATSALVLASGAAMAATGAHVEFTDKAFAHEGPFGKFDQMQLQRGLQVFTEICSSCHGLKYVPIRTLADPGGPQLPADQVRAYAEGLDAVPLADGEERPREWTDHFPSRAGDGMGPDLSLMAKARAGFHGPYGTGMSQLFNGMGGPEYIYSILTHFEENPACAPEGIDGYYYNSAFPNGGVPDSCKDEHGISTVPGSWIAMAPPLMDDMVTYADGTPATLDQLAEDAASFLYWAAEPKLMARKQAGFIAVTFLVVLSALLFLTNKKLWAGVKGKKVTI
ncbi:cytochrome c1 [Fuscovulum blasticum]|uniref:cytochrome c1 n=1 Tax=Fuscovulum blasticum TaxID=1075 RepID=UPI000D505955|nr:cytochrome c1 [Fuscovulum blasticum]AWD21946.1 cytochrome c1 [Fuscovulum blasticum]